MKPAAHIHSRSMTLAVAMTNFSHNAFTRLPIADCRLPIADCRLRSSRRKQDFAKLQAATPVRFPR
jgi:hypothetical protein